MEILSFLENHRTQILSIIGSFLLLWMIFRLIQKRKLRVEFALLWLFLGLLFLLVGVFRSALEGLAEITGILYAPAALLLLLILGIFLILIHYSTIISKLAEQNKILTQELALLKHQIHQDKSHEKAP